MAGLLWGKRRKKESPLPDRGQGGALEEVFEAFQLAVDVAGGQFGLDAGDEGFELFVGQVYAKEGFNGLDGVFLEFLQQRRVTL